MDIRVRYLFDLLLPFLCKMSTEQAFAALRECVQGQFLSEEQLDGIIAIWAEHPYHVKRRTTSDR